MGIGRSHREPTGKQLEWLAAAAYVNSRELGEESLMLLGSNRLPRAAFLALASFEEWLKGRYCERGVIEEDEYGFFEVFNSHRKKLSFLGEFADEGETPRESVEVLLRFRERALYVDVGDHGQTLTPNGLVDPGGMDPAKIAGLVAWTHAEVVKRIELAVRAKEEGESGETSST